jgi:hypothetical protein
MASRADGSRAFLRSLFAGAFPGHGVIMDPQTHPAPFPGDAAVSDRPVRDWLPWVLKCYEAQVRWHEAIGGDAVPSVNLWTGTEVFAAAFGCPVHLYPDSPPCALPLVDTATEADRLPVPRLSARPLERILELGMLARVEVGPDVPIRVPDIQSPFDVAALVWRKEAFYLAMVDALDAVRSLVSKCDDLLRTFLREFRRQQTEPSFAHCPNAWAPPELGCWLSEDEAGSMSAAMFDEFCLPVLVGLSAEFGGLFMHCCADADHQYGNFRKIPNLRGLNRVFTRDPRATIEAFSDGAVLMVAWSDLASIRALLDMALPTTRFLFNMPAEPLDDAKRTYDTLRALCPRAG